MKVTTKEFIGSLGQSAPPAGLSVPLRSLWHSARGDWEKAHILVQDDPSGEAAWVHAYLHRIEGDAGNAGYWYHRAGRAPTNAPVEDERELIARTLLGE